MTLEPDENVPLAPFTSLGVGGPARYFILAHSEHALIQGLEFAKQYRLEPHVLGAGSNVVISDAGVDGLVIRVRLTGVRAEHSGKSVLVTAAAGENWDELVSRAVANGWAGIECLSGIPGLVGATPIQNVGAYGQDVSETIASVHAFDTTTASVVELTPAECGFAYRDSTFKSRQRRRYVVLGVTYALTAGGPPKIHYAELEAGLEQRGVTSPNLQDVRESVLAIRRSKSMVLDATDRNTRGCGSFFLNPLIAADELARVRERTGAEQLPHFPQADGRVKLSAAWLIENAGFSKGQTFRTAGLSSRHSLALVSHGDARAADVVDFARLIRRTVYDRSGVTLIPEPAFWGFASLDQGLPDERLT